MTETMKLQLAMDPYGMAEGCDCCGALIINRKWFWRTVILEDGKIVCLDCKGILTAQKVS